MIVYLNGEFLPQEEAKVSPTDRGFLFGDGIYEAIPYYKGKPFAFDGHWKRLQDGLGFLRIDFADHDEEKMKKVFDELLNRNNGLQQMTRAMIYLQITRGAPPTRSHVFPVSNGTVVKPTVFATCQEIAYPSPERWTAGFSAALVPDQRWGRVDIKTVNLLANVLAAQEAKDKGADEAIFVTEDDAHLITEGSKANVFGILKDDANGGSKIVTHPLSRQILPGITRNMVVQVARNAGLIVEERAMTRAELTEEAQEVFITSTTTEIKPIVKIDGKVVGDGKAGPMSTKLVALLRSQIEVETGVKLD
ncbi:D-alanine aminotransferase [Seminavis robusta]|uniref:D-alanine aminotransferase n=1 Tax=Seminavis robusta TaxID=568900 RepID=A0A9N8DR51_9STRA|nr:D-alanine aminotransferase [Seminavis robusta]|eukprot:Sro296_g110650.1 D-alanine aminotransferase (306) ;mRNA; f:30193-31110